MKLKRTEEKQRWAEVVARDMYFKYARNRLYLRVTKVLVLYTLQSRMLDGLTDKNLT